MLRAVLTICGAKYVLNLRNGRENNVLAAPIMARGISLNQVADR